MMTDREFEKAVEVLDAVEMGLTLNVTSDDGRVRQLSMTRNNLIEIVSEKGNHLCTLSRSETIKWFDTIGIRDVEAV